MEERKISIDGITHSLTPPFFVVGTQNPREQIGTYPLPESQLDRFLMRIHMGFPSSEAELQLLRGGRKQEEEIAPLLSRTEVLQLQDTCEKVHASETILKFVHAILVQSRGLRADFSGLSPRSGLAMLSAGRAWAFLAGRDYVIPEDIQDTAPWVINHRMRFSTAVAFEKSKEFILSVPVE
jgi:MoxR-like ATPase